MEGTRLQRFTSIGTICMPQLGMVGLQTNTSKNTHSHPCIWHTHTGIDKSQLDPCAILMKSPAQKGPWTSAVYTGSLQDSTQLHCCVEHIPETVVPCSFMFFQHPCLEGQPAHRPTKHLSTKTSEWWKAENRQRCLALPRVYSVGVSIDVLPPSSRSTRRGDSFWWRTMDVRML